MCPVLYCNHNERHRHEVRDDRARPCGCGCKARCKLAAPNYNIFLTVSPLFTAKTAPDLVTTVLRATCYSPSVTNFPEPNYLTCPSTYLPAHSKPKPFHLRFVPTHLSLTRIKAIRFITHHSRTHRIPHLHSYLLNRFPLVLFLSQTSITSNQSPSHLHNVFRQLPAIVGASYSHRPVYRRKLRSSSHCQRYQWDQCQRHFGGQ